MFTRLYCHQCRDSLGHHKAPGKHTLDSSHQVKVVKKTSSSSYTCVYKICGHIWKSKSVEAEREFGLQSKLKTGDIKSSITIVVDKKVKALFETITTREPESLYEYNPDDISLKNLITCIKK